MTRGVSVIVKCNTIFRLFFLNYHNFIQFHTSNLRKVVQQHFLLTFTYLHTEGVVGSIIWVLLEIYLAFQQ